MYNKQRGIRRVWLPRAQTPLEWVFLTLELSNPDGLIAGEKMSSEWVVEEGSDEYHWQPQHQLQSWGLHSISLTSFCRFPPPEEMPMETVEELLSKYGRRMDGTKDELWGGWSTLSLGLSKWFKDMMAYQGFLIQMCVWFSGLKGRGTWLIPKDCLALSPKPSICLENWMEISRREKALVFIVPHVHLTGIKHGDI